MLYNRTHHYYDNLFLRRKRLNIRKDYNLNRTKINNFNIKASSNKKNNINIVDIYLEKMNVPHYS